tara:strand:+ start:193 stop:1164 length:972 start_codon:yes stop_codon:yes gene_type:complete
MTKVKYYYDKKSLSYKKINLTLKKKIQNLFIFIFSASIITSLSFFVFYSFFDSPKEKKLKAEINYLTSNYQKFERKLLEIETVLDDIQKRDDNIYREIFEADPIPTEIRKAGFGGVNKYKYLEGFSNTELLKTLDKKLDILKKQLYVQSKSFDQVIKLTKDKNKMLSSIPAIQPLSNKDLSRMASGFGYRIDPIYKTRKFHAGMDFSAKTGTPIYATGDGKIYKVKNSKRGYGNHVIIDHGYGYKTLYAHMSKNAVKKNQKVKRGDIIGFVGNTGKSVAPHLHYEVHKNGKKINPVNFYYNDLNAEEYEKMIEISTQSNQSFD